MSTTPFLAQCSHCQKKIKLTDRSVIGKHAKCPGCQQKFKIEEYAPTPTLSPAVEINPPQASTNLADTSVTPSMSTTKPVSPAEFDFAQLATATTALPVKPRKQEGYSSWIMLSLSMLVILIGGGWYINKFVNDKPEAKKPAKVVVTEAYKQAATEKVDQFKLVQELDPTQGEPLNLKLLPAGIRIAVHMRVGEIYGDNQQWQELRASLGPLSEWLKAQIETYCHFKINQIDQVLVGVILGSRGTPPEIATVVKLKQPASLSDVLINFQVAPLSQFGNDVYGNDKFAFVMVNQQTFAFCPPALIEEVVNFRQQNTNATDGITALFTSGKQDAHVAIAFENDDLFQHIPYIFPSNTQSLLTNMSDWFGRDAETTLMTFQLQEPFFAELIVRNRAATKAATLQRSLMKNLGTLPQEVMAITRKMKPAQLGYQQLIGRLPAMLKVLSLCTTSCTEKQAVHLVTVMPLKAAPNLAAAALLAWDESTRTNFLLADTTNASPTVKEQPKKNLPESIADRMKFKIDVEFNRVPLQDAFAFIANEIEVKVDIDGDALKAGGYTKNMPQTFSMKQSSVADICQKIVGQYNQTEIMCIAIDEKTKTLYVLTESVAKAKNIAIYK